jgi:hypothetical protein
MKKLNSKKPGNRGKSKPFGGMPREGSTPSETPGSPPSKHGKPLKEFQSEKLDKMNGVPNEDPATPKPKKPKLLRFDAPGCKYELE